MKELNIWDFMRENAIENSPGINWHSFSDVPENKAMELEKIYYGIGGTQFDCYKCDNGNFSGRFHY